MPRKKKVEVEAVETPKEEVIVPKVCGHINKHYINPNGDLTDLACTLKPGHGGDHSAPCEKNVGSPVTNEKGITVKTAWVVEPSVAYWNDAASKPAVDIESEVVIDMTAYQKDLVMDMLKRNPTMDVDMAIAKAKMQDNWKIQERR